MLKFSREAVLLIKKVYPLDLRKEISRLQRIDVDLFFYIHFISGKERFEVISRNRDLGKEIVKFTKFAEDTIKDLKKVTSKKYT